MSEPWLLAAELLCNVCGMAWFALAMQVHWQQVRGNAGRSMTMVRVLRSLGTLALVGSLLLCLSANHPSIAALVWVMSLAASALLIAFALAWRPRLLSWLVVCAPE